MKYCEKCHLLIEAQRCTFCGNKAIRDVTFDDFCFLTECEQILGEMLRDALEDEGIKCVLVPSGNGVRSAFGLSLGGYRVFVPYGHCAKARDTFALLLGEPSVDELRAELLENADKWHIVKESTAKKIRKKLGADKGADVYRLIKDYVKSTDSIKDNGTVSYFGYPTRVLTVKIGEFSVWFAMDEFEILA